MTHSRRSPLATRSPTRCTSRSGRVLVPPHIREDYGQEMGLYGNIHVVPAEPDYWPPTTASCS